MGCPIGVNSLFGPPDKFIKFHGGDAIAVEGPNTVQRQILNDLRFPYEQVLHSKLVLKKGQVSYLLNHLGLGDNATFLLISARYDPKSRIEEDNYVVYNYYSDFSRTYTFAQCLLLTGNSTNRIPQLYLTNPNATYSVSMEVMVANIDDIYNYFEDIINQTGSSFTGLSASNISSHVVGESISIKNNRGLDMIYIQLGNINALQLMSKIVVLNDNIIGDIFLQFISEEEAAQGFSLLNYVLENPNVDISLLEPLRDLVPPVIYFNNRVGGTGDFIYLDGSYVEGPYSTIDGNTFSANVSLDDFGGTFSIITKENLLDMIVDYVTDNRDGTMSLTTNNINIYDFDGITISSIQDIGTYSMWFEFSDLALNSLNDVNFNLNVYEGDLNPSPTATIFFNSQVGGDGDWIYLMGSSASVPYSSLDGNTFSTTISITDYNVGGEIDGAYMIDLLVDSVLDSNDDILTLTSDNVILNDIDGITISSILGTGTYSVRFDLATYSILNTENVNVEINIIT